MLTCGSPPNYSSNYYSELKFVYGSGIADSNEDLLSKILLGKDYYLPHLGRLYPFKFDFNYEITPAFISATNPYHPGNVTFTYTNSSTGPEIFEAASAYQFNDMKLLSKVTFDVVGDSEAVMIF